MSRTSIHSSSGTLYIRSSPLNLFLTSTVRDLIQVIPEWSSGFAYFLQFKSEFGNKKFMIWATVSSWSCFCWLYRASPLWLQRIQLVWFQFWPFTLLFLLWSDTQRFTRPHDLRQLVVFRTISHVHSFLLFSAMQICLPERHPNSDLFLEGQQSLLHCTVVKIFQLFYTHVPQTNSYNSHRTVKNWLDGVPRVH